jgi:class II poly(R)-hydroxyalkanoic acid synthase
MATQERTRRGAQKNGNGRPRAGQRDAAEAIIEDIAMGPGRVLPGVAGLKLAGKLATRPHKIAGRAAGLGLELGKVAVGRSELEPEKGDRRFKDPAWKHNPAFRRLLQSYLAAGEAVDEVISDADLDWRSDKRVRFTAENVLDLLAPSNNPWLNPTVLKATIDSGGLHFLAGLRNLVNDLGRPPFLPSSVDSSKFEVGEDLATTPGSVVLRTEVLELIQYHPQTAKVREVPLLCVPQMINKYYVADLAPGKSMFEWAVNQGQQVFTISWRNPDERHAEWNLDTYLEGVLDALAAVETITGTDRTHLLGLCAGGTLASIVAARLSDRGEGERVAGLTLGVNVLDSEKSGEASALLDDMGAGAAMAESARKGYLSGKSLAGLFAWLRPNDMIWGYWVNNYLLGRQPPAWDVLYWNNDQTNMPAALHRDFVQMSRENSLVKPGELEALGGPVDLSQITADSYLVAGIGDHISPWQNAYRTTQLLGSEPRFVLSTSGHIVAMVNPPGEDKANFKLNPANPPDAKRWLRDATTQEGSWWPDWTDWLGERSGAEVDPPPEAGARPDLPALDPAPGTYVLAEA